MKFDAWAQARVGLGPGTPLALPPVSRHLIKFINSFKKSGQVKTIPNVPVVMTLTILVRETYFINT